MHSEYDEARPLDHRPVVHSRGWVAAAETEVVAALGEGQVHNLDSSRVEVEELAGSMTEQVLEALEDMHIAQDEEPADQVVLLGTVFVEGVGLMVELGYLNCFLDPTSRGA